MSESNTGSRGNCLDPDDAPEWTGAMFGEAEIAIGGEVVRPGKWRSAGRPPLGTVTKRQVTLRLDPDVIEKFRESGPGWQGRMNEALRKAVGL